jgi:integrase
VPALLAALDLREQLIVRLALFSGMRPGEILALQWKHVAEDHVEVIQRLYRGKLDRPKSERSKRKVALSSGTREFMNQWRRKQASADPDAWVFPSAITTTPLGRDNTWRCLMAPRLGDPPEWATFQVMRRTHASLSRRAGIDPKLVADQLGHGLGVSLEVYTMATLEQRQEAVQTLEASLAGGPPSPALNEEEPPLWKRGRWRFQGVNHDGNRSNA